MDQTQLPTEAAEGRISPAMLDELSSQPTLGKKRPAPDIDSADQTTKRLKGDVSPDVVSSPASLEEGELSDSKLSGSEPPEAKLVEPVEPVESKSLVLPEGEPNFTKVKRVGHWKGRFQDWCLRVMALNKGHEDLTNPDLLRATWRGWLKTRKSITRADRPLASKAATDVDLDPQMLKEMVSKSTEVDPHAPWNKPQKADTNAQSPGSDQQDAPDTASQSPKTASSGSQEANDWALPTMSLSQFEVRQKDVRGWEEKFKTWCTSLHRLNGGKIKGIEGLSKAKAAVARRSAVHYAQENSAILAAIFATKLAPAPVPVAAPVPALAPTEPQAMRQPAAAPQNDITLASDLDAVSDAPDNTSMDIPFEGEAAYRARYFPGISADEVFCHLCASPDHSAASCPNIACRFCDSGRHRSFNCPTRHRCTKCKQLGHTKHQCKEKLAIPADEQECAFCGGRDHDDALCHEHWRSFVVCNPNTAAPPRKVRSLPVYCYTCGRQGHYGTVCGLNPDKAARPSLWETWSQANCERYVDPASAEVAVVYNNATGSAASNPASDRPDLGKSIVPSRHIFFEEEEEDDEDDGFIRPPVKAARTGHIRVAGSGGGAYSNGYAQQQPPLPPGPPPPLPPQSYQESRRNGGRRRGGEEEGDGTRYLFV
ncbi:hypothetical protein N0V88_000869 [Collariella sp. IMI 366227]|nr:hypothetical protein N0V88_000869 [Collariella sp. IMI 366227]